MTKKKSPTRRDFLKTSALTGVGYWAMAGNVSRARAQANDRISVAGFGVEGKGSSDIAAASKYCDVAVLCDVDRTRLANALKKYPKAKCFTDYRQAFDEMEKSFDVVTVSTPDHAHGVITLRALRAKKHAYTQKPLTRTIYEARLLGNVAKEMGVVTQMGNQGSGSDGLRQGAAQVKAGVLGTVQAVHVWSNRPVWPQAPGRRMTMEKYAQEANAKNDAELAAEMIAEAQKTNDKELLNLDWENWIGPAQMRPFWPKLYHPFAWRGWWDFGGGALADMACHTVNLPYAACDLKFPTSVIAKTSGHDYDSYPASSEIIFEFPATEYRPAIKFYWYDGAFAPSNDLVEKYGFEVFTGRTGAPRQTKVSGALIIGDKGAMYSKDDYGGTWELKGNTPGEKLEPLSASSLTFPKNEGGHEGEFYNSVLNNTPEKCWSNFSGYAGPLTETILLGNLAVWAAAGENQWGEKVEWDAKNLKVTNLAALKTPGVAGLVKPVVRSGHFIE